jgi:putative addiction module component (TIGR02574 family)
MSLDTGDEWDCRHSRQRDLEITLMSTSSQLPDLTQLSIAERILVVQQIWDSIAAEQTPLPMTPAQRAELDRRLETHRTSPGEGSPWEEVKARIQSKG